MNNKKNKLKLHKAVFDSEDETCLIDILDLELSEEEKKELKIKFDGWSVKFIEKLKIVGIKRLLEEYKRLVLSCRDEKSYYGKYENEGSKENWRYGPGISYEYLNYISCRTALQIILDNVAVEKIVDIKMIIKEYDQILKPLIDINPKVLNKKENKKYPREVYWWKYKLPINVIE